MENGFLFVQEEKLIQQNDIISEKDITVSKDIIEYLDKFDSQTPLQASGSWGPISWDADYHIDTTNIMNSYAFLKVKIFGVTIIDTRLDAQNPKATVDLTVAGVGVKAELGIDFNARRIYFNGYLNYIISRKDFNITIFSF